MFLFFCFLLLTTAVSATTDVKEVAKKTIPLFSLADLRENLRAEEFATILRTTGLLTIETPSFDDTLRYDALGGLCQCKNQLLHVDNSDTSILADGSTVRTTVATATVGTTPHPLSANLAEHCGHDTAMSMERIRDEVAIAGDAFLQALDVLIGNNKYNGNALLRDSKGHSYNRVTSIVNAANHLEHFHIYSKMTASDESSLQWHTDAGLFLSFVPAVNCHGPATNADASFWYMDEDGTSTRAVFSPTSIAIMLGAGAEHWLQSPVPLKATRHAVTNMREGDERAWYGMMYLVPERAIIQESPPKTFRDMKESMTLPLKGMAHGQGGSSSESIGCGSTTTSSAEENVPNLSSLDIAPVPRRRLQMVGSASDCNNSTNFFCWMSCLDIPNVDQVESFVTAGYSLYCLDPSILSSSGNDVSQAVAECPDTVHNAKCLGSWQLSVPGVPSTTVLYNKTNASGNEEPFCYGGTSMFMDGFHWMDTVCIIYLFPEWVLNTEGKFVAASIGSLFVGMFLEVVILRRRMIMSSMAPGYHRLAASAMFYGLQLTVGYLAMLVVMTYSGPLFMCIILGIIFGHVLFNAKDAVFATAAKEPIFKTVAASDDDNDNAGARVQVLQSNNSCCLVESADLPEPEQSPTSYEANDGVPEGITPCCQHTL